MRFNTPLLFAVLSISLFLAGCGGAGGSTTPYDGTWAASYSGLSQKSTITDTQSVKCDFIPATLIIRQSTGSATQATRCVTSAITAASGVPPTSTVMFIQSTLAYISISISPDNTTGNPDVVKAIVNGVTFTGKCISNDACAAATADETLNLTRL